ncbi:GcrA family cell cycle regulator [Sandarakinorhabdus sp.]|uniref:GcrA family cell cycle regulator n=1 Tax=Sandarakinorhabdus sp. TaxID=1916663 RepID=UPI00356A8009
MADVEWTDDLVAKLRTLWASGMPVAQIGREMKISKNAVAGKVHRLDLPGRPSPIKGGGRNPRKSRVLALPHGKARGGYGGGAGSALRGDTLGPLAALAGNKLAAVRETVCAAMPAPAAVAVVLRGKSEACRWPIGEPGAKDFRFCEAAGRPGSSYCAGHHAIAWVTVRPRSEAEHAADFVRAAHARRRHMVGA